MGKMNLLKADYTGKVAQTYGYRRKKASVIAAVPFSHTPHNDAQKSQWTAFTKAQKLNGIIAKTIFRYTGLSDKKVNKINAVATKLKSLVVEHVYIPQIIETAIINTESLQILNIYDYEPSKEIEIIISNDFVSEGDGEEKILLVLFSTDGAIIAHKVAGIESGEYSYTMIYNENVWDYLITIKCIHVKKGWSMADGRCIYANNEIVERV